MTLRGMEHISKQALLAANSRRYFVSRTGTKLEPHRLFWKISRKSEQHGIASFRFDFGS
jgi:uncharacterized protein